MSSEITKSLGDLLSQPKNQADFGAGPAEKLKREELAPAQVARQRRLHEASQAIASYRAEWHRLNQTESADNPDLEMFGELIDKALSHYLDIYVFGSHKPLSIVTFGDKTKALTAAKTSDYARFEMYGNPQEAYLAIKEYIKHEWLNSPIELPWRHLKVTATENSVHVTIVITFGPKDTQKIEYQLTNYSGIRKITLSDVNNLYNLSLSRLQKDPHSDLYKLDVAGAEFAQRVVEQRQARETGLLQTKDALLEAERTQAYLSHDVWDKQVQVEVPLEEDKWSEQVFKGFFSPIQSSLSPDRSVVLDENCQIHLRKGFSGDMETGEKDDYYEVAIATDFPFAISMYGHLGSTFNEYLGIVKEFRMYPDRNSERLVVRVEVRGQPLYLTLTVPMDGKTQTGPATLLLNNERYANLEAELPSMVELAELGLTAVEIQSYWVGLAHAYCQNELGLALNEATYKTAFSQRLQMIDEIYRLQAFSPYSNQAELAGQAASYGSLVQVIHDYFSSSADHTTYQENDKLLNKSKPITLPATNDFGDVLEKKSREFAIVEDERQELLAVQKVLSPKVKKTTEFVSLLGSHLSLKKNTAYHKQLINLEVARLTEFTWMWSLPREEFLKAVFNHFQSGVKSGFRKVNFSAKISAQNFHLFKLMYRDQLRELLNFKAEYQKHAQEVMSRVTELTQPEFLPDRLDEAYAHLSKPAAAVADYSEIDESLLKQAGKDQS